MKRVLFIILAMTLGCTSLMRSEKPKCISGDCINSQGTLRSANGTYAGQFKEGKFNGNGTLTLYNGSTYTGQWLNGKMHGKGVLTTVDNTTYNGQWENDVFIDSKVKIYIIGDRGPAGGWVFYDKGNYSEGWRYLEAAPEDQSSNDRFIATREPVADDTGIGTGKSNTQMIVSVTGSDDDISIIRMSEVGFDKTYAALTCVHYQGGGKSDWFLPSKDELNLMFENLVVKGIGDFGAKDLVTPNGLIIKVYYDGNYWSSSQYYGDSIWIQSLINGYQFIGRNQDYPSNGVEGKLIGHRVRAIRMF